MMLAIEENQIHSAFSANNALCRLQAWRRIAFGEPGAATTALATESSAKSGSFSMDDMHLLFADDLRHATDWHVQHRARS